MPDTIRYITREEIDHVKWDDCITKATNGLIYAYSFYLDKMTTHWDALILGDYEYVMPLPWRKKMGIFYLYKPAFIASLGIFGNSPDQETSKAFLNKIPSKFKLIAIDLNNGNDLNGSNVKIDQRINYILPLNRSYIDIRSGYRDNLQRNIKKAAQFKVSYSKDIPIEDIITISRSQLPVGSSISDLDFKNFTELFRVLKMEEKAVTRAVYSNTGKILASCVFFFSHHRAYYILVGNHPNGKTLGASHYLIDQFVQEYANSELVLDFEGSDIRNLAFFYSSFGASVETYPAVTIDRLPWWVRWVR